MLFEYFYLLPSIDEEIKITMTTIDDNIINQLYFLIDIIQKSANNGPNCYRLPAILGYLIGQTAVIAIYISKDNLWMLRNYSLLVTIMFLIAVVDITSIFKIDAGFQLNAKWLLMPDYNIYLSFGVDGVSLCFLILTALMGPICILASSTMKKNYKEFIIFILLIEIFLAISFTVTNIIFYYIFFESVLIPMFAIIGIWGARERKISASMYFFIYTVFGSFFMLYGIYCIYDICGTFEYQIILHTSFTREEQLLLFVCFFIPFAIKIPMMPLHIWLPEAHVEAPTIGSVLLASLLLKLGGYGLLRFTIPMFPAACEYYFPYVATWAAASVLFASCIAMRQTDMKRVIAYSSIAHMNLIVLGLFSFTHQGIDGAIYLMIAHGLVSAALFFCVGVLYERYHTRSLKHFSGLATVMPLFCGHFFIFTLANMGLPLTANFVGELLIFVGIFEKHSLIMTVGALGIVLSAVYAIWLYNRVAFGTLKSNTENIPRYADISRPEVYILVVLAAGVLALGLNAAFVTNITCLPIKKILLTSVYRW